MSEEYKIWLVLAILLFSNLIFLILALIVFLRLIKLIKRKFRKITNEFPHSLKASVAALGISILIFRELVTDSIQRMISFFVINFRYFSEALATNSVLTAIESGSPNSLVQVMQFWTKSLFTSFSQEVIGLQFERLILFFLTWIIITIIISSIFNDTKSKWQEIIKSERFRFFQFFSLIILGIYLSIASIIAIPAFGREEDNAIELSTTELVNELNRYKLSDTEFLEKYKLESSTIINDSSIQYYSLKNMQDVWNQLVDNSAFELNQNYDLAIGKFALVLKDNLLQKDKLRYQSELIDWYLSNKSIITNSLNIKQTAVKNLLQMAPLITDGKDYQDLSVLYNSIGNLQLPPLNRVPKKPVLGENWGIFKVIAGWLLATESTSLALITGMFGFGLFGATISSFVRDRNKNLNEVLGSDIVSVIIRGFSAAIVIFLTVKGGLAIFTTNNSEINPYILFFTCLAAAVFSDDAWFWARKRFNNSFENKNESRT